MNKKDILYLVISVLTGLYISESIHAAAPIELAKVFYHKAPVAKKNIRNIKSTQQNQLELGKVVLYFSSQPDIINTQVHNSQEHIMKIIFNNIDSTKSHDLIKQLNAIKGQGYHLSASLSQHVAGDTQKAPSSLELLVKYDYKKVHVECERYDAISSYKSVVISLYNKDVLDNIQKKESSILRVAEKKKSSIIAAAPVLSAPMFSVIVDCGHGGHDSGAIGSTGLTEKEVTLAVGREVKKMLASHGITAYMTRSSDEYKGLDERTLFANTMADADLFISIHANAASNKNAQGIETYCLKPDLFTSLVNNNYLNIGLEPGYLDHKKVVHQCLLERYNDSDRCAHLVHNHCLAGSCASGYTIVDRGVKYSVPQVLLGTYKPAILVELGYISHPNEEQLLATTGYQKVCAQGIVNGIISYFKSY